MPSTLTHMSPLERLTLSVEFSMGREEKAVPVHRRSPDQVSVEQRSRDLEN